MRAFVEDEEDRYERPKRSRDVEMTLGGGTVVLFVLGLVLVCGLCFGAGYFVGHRGAPAQPAADASNAPVAQAPLPAGSSTPKPSANSQPVVPPPSVDASQTAPDAQPATGDAPQSVAAVTIPAVSAPSANHAAAPAVPAPQARPVQQPPSAPATAQTAAQPQAHAATAPPQAHAAAAPAQTHAAASTPAAQPVGAQLMVQIAAVSHPEDADVLIGALRKHGYTVTARHESDGLIHVRIGPFSTHQDAETWRLKLLNDGYNAMIQP